MRLVIIGAGFAGMYAALSAARLRDIKGASPEKLEIALVAPQPTLVVRPRLYESRARDADCAATGCPQGDRCSLRTGQRRDGRYQGVRGRNLDLRGKAKEALLRSPGCGHGQPALSSEVFPASLSTVSASTRSTMRSPLTSICTAWPIVQLRTDATRWSWPVAGSPASRRLPRCRRGSARVSGTTPNHASSSWSATLRSLPIWVKVPRPVIEDALKQLGVETRTRRGRYLARRFRCHAVQWRAYRN